MGIALDKFLEDVEKLQNGIAYHISLEEFSRKTPLNENDGDDHGDYIQAAKALHAQVHSHRQSLSYYAPSIFLYSCGRFEHYVKSSIEELASYIASTSQSYRKMSKEMRESIVIFTAEVVKNPRKYGHGEGAAGAFAKTLSDNLNLDSSEISVQCLSITSTNIRSEVIDELFKRIGFKDVWKTIGEQVSCKQRYISHEQPRATSEAQKELREIMDERNKIAHPAAETVLPSISKTSAAVEYFKMLAICIDAFVETCKIKHQATINGA